MSKGVYVFGAILEKQPQSFGMVQLNSAQRPVYTIHFQDVGMVICQIDDEVLPTRDNLLSHQRMVSKIMEKYVLIPMAFGNVLSSEDDVLLITNHLYPEFDSLFPQLQNTIEVGLKIIANQQWLESEVAKDSVIQGLKDQVNKKDSDAAFYDRIRLGELAHKFFLSLQEHIENEIYLPLSSIAKSSKLNNLLTESMLLNGAFLIDRNDEEAFDNKINELYTIWQDKVEFKYTGPWPPYNFVNIRLRIEGNI